MREYFSINQAPLGQSLSLTRIVGDHALIRRLLGLGIRVGSQLVVTQRRGGGVVIASQDARIAMGPGLASRLMVCMDCEGESAHGLL